MTPQTYKPLSWLLSLSLVLSSHWAWAQSVSYQYTDQNNQQRQLTVTNGSIQWNCTSSDCNENDTQHIYMREANYRYMEYPHQYSVQVNYKSFQSEEERYQNCVGRSYLTYDTISYIYRNYETRDTPIQSETPYFYTTLVQYCPDGIYVKKFYQETPEEKEILIRQMNDSGDDAGRIKTFLASTALIYVVVGDALLKEIYNGIKDEVARSIHSRKALKSSTINWEKIISVDNNGVVSSQPYSKTKTILTGATLHEANNDAALLQSLLILTETDSLDDFVEDKFEETQKTQYEDLHSL